MEEIAAASKEQSDGIGQINRAVSDMNRVTQQNAANAEELASVMATFKVENSQGKTVRHSPKKVTEQSRPGDGSVPADPFVQQKEAAAF
jgi:methyl-accepting chemotaxis protein